MANIDLEHPQEGFNAPVSFAAADVKKDGDKITLTMKVYEQELFDAVEVSQLKAGDTITAGGEEVKITKIEEIKTILGAVMPDAEFKAMGEVGGLPEPEETGTTFEENAFIKAEAACKETGLPAVADDSGLCVDYLDGAPGIYPARFAQPGKRRLTVLEKLQGVPAEQRGAHFVSAVCCVFPNGDKIEAEGKCFGTIAFDSRGENGFGYDSIFEQEGRTFGEMSDEEKDARSHRGKAFALFEEKLKEYLKKGE